ncbi:glycosyltransferase [Nibrella saemangeumensis]|uniref:Glycosyltransferase n=1 Tax=Nibrella saemangeumensis TaxID=1084526 RepID=A0ABP8N347_9BACT
MPFAIAVLITCHNRKEKTLLCLQQLFKQIILIKEFSFDVYLVDDASSDGTTEAVNLIFPNVIVIKGNGNLFWNRGMHLAWSYASNLKDYDFFLWLNDDSFLEPFAMQELLECENFKSQFVIVCGALCSAVDGTFSYGGRSSVGDNIVPNGSFQNCSFINGNCVLISKRVFHLVGNLDPFYPHAIGDIDYGLRALKLGVKIITTRKYIGFCERNTSSPKWCSPKLNLYERLKILYSPLGYSHPFFFFRFELKHFGLFIALKHFFTIHLRMFSPNLWRTLKNLT